MKIAGIYSFNNGQKLIAKQRHTELEEIKRIITNVDASLCKTKVGKEKTNEGRLLYKPSELNAQYDKHFTAFHWQKHRVSCEYSTAYYTADYMPNNKLRPAFREMDFVKNRLGVEVQFGKYAFMVYNVCAKMTIFHNHNVIDLGVEIVPIKSLADEMSTGVSYFEQFVWDLQQRGIADIDIPVLILGVAA